MLKCLPTSNKLLLLRWFRFQLILTNSLQNRITLLLVLKLLQSNKLTPCIHFFFFYFITMCLFLLSPFSYLFIFFFLFHYPNLTFLFSQISSLFKKEKRKKKDSYYKTSTITSIHPYCKNQIWGLNPKDG